MYGTTIYIFNGKETVSEEQQQITQVTEMVGQVDIACLNIFDDWGKQMIYAHERVAAWLQWTSLARST